MRPEPQCGGHLDLVLSSLCRPSQLKSSCTQGDAEPKSLLGQDSNIGVCVCVVFIVALIRQYVHPSSYSHEELHSKPEKLCSSVMFIQSRIFLLLQDSEAAEAQPDSKPMPDTDMHTHTH